MPVYNNPRKWKRLFAILFWLLFLPTIIVGSQSVHHEHQVAYHRWGPRLVGTLTEITGPISGSIDKSYVPAIISFTDRNGNPGRTPRPILVSSHKAVGDTFKVWVKDQSKEVFIAGDLERYGYSPYPSPIGKFVSWFLYLELFPIGLYLLFAHDVRKLLRQEQREQQSKGVSTIGVAA